MTVPYATPKIISEIAMSQKMIYAGCNIENDWDETDPCFSSPLTS